jgi:hypothetical protein
MTEPETSPGEWLTMSAAMARSGWHLQRLQSRARREEWPRRRPNKGPMEYLVPASVLAVKGADIASGNGMPSPATASANDHDIAADDAVTSPAWLHEEVAELWERCGRAEGLAEARAQHIASLEARLAVSEAALAEVRKGWLERLLEAVRRR